MIYLLAIWAELVYEVRNGDKHELSSVVVLCSLIALSVLYGGWEGGLIYLGLRFALFDISFAYLRGHNWDYLGNTSTYDQVLKNINRWVLLAFRVAAITTVLYYERII